MLKILEFMKKAKKILMAFIFVGLISLSLLTLTIGGRIIQEFGEDSVKYRGFVNPPLGYNDSFPDYYITINDVPDILDMSIALQIKNQDGEGYYFKIEDVNSPSGWEIDPMEIGRIGVDGTRNFVYSLSKHNPISIAEGRKTETVELVVKAYRDEDYTDLYSQDNFEVTYHFIDRKSDVWTIEEHNNFTGGTNEGWYSPTHTSTRKSRVSEGYYRSFPYSIRTRGTFKKTFTPEEKNEAYLIFSVRPVATSFVRGFQIRINGRTHFKPDIEPSMHKWLQFIVPFKPGENNTISIGDPRSSSTINEFAYLDDVYLISK